MRRTRFDDSYCPIARVTDLFGDWWTPIVLRDAMFGATRFEHFQEKMGMSRSVLAQRLARLVDEGLFEKVPYQERPLRHEYLLTDKGRAACDVLVVMWRFGEDHMWPKGEAPSVELSFHDTGDPIRAVVVDETSGRPIEINSVRFRQRR